MDDTSLPKGPAPLAAGWSMLKAVVGSRPPKHRATYTQRLDHTELGGVLATLKQGGVSALRDERSTIASYRRALEKIDPSALSRSEGLAYWLNLYNAGALNLAAEATINGTVSVLRVPGGFSREWTVVNGKSLSLDAIEHGKVRRYNDPRIHGALVCGSASCPTLRYAPYSGDDLDTQLEAQMQDFLASGGAAVQGDTVLLSRVLKWFGSDFVRPATMPYLLPFSKAALQHSVAPWLPAEAAKALTNGAAIEFQPYDWSLACAIR